MNWFRRQRKKRSASGANLPTSPTDARLQEEEGDEYHFGGRSDGGGGGGGGGGGRRVGVSDGCGHHVDDDLDDEDLDDEDYGFWNFEDEEGEDEDVSAVEACANSLGRSLLCGAWSR